MNLDVYQAYTDDTALYDKAQGIVYNALKLAGEAGEVADKVGKAVGAGRELTYEDFDALVLELGDVLWHAAQLAKCLGVPLSRVAAKNLAKLQRRKNNNVIFGEGDNR